MSSTLWGIGLTGDYTLGENGWRDSMNANLRKLTTLTQAIAINKDLATPPVSPAMGDTYIIAASPTGAWSGKATNIAVYDGSSWVFYAPSVGWRFYVYYEDAYYRFNGTVWGIL